MSGFSFSTTAGASQGAVTSRLVGNKIHKVIFEGAEVKDMVGKQAHNEGIVYKTLSLRFANDEGVYEHSIFEPIAKDFVRTETSYTDKQTGEEKKIPQPSNVESMMLLFKHAIDAINPKVAKAIDDKTQNLGAKDWDSLRDLVIKILNAGKGVETSIKLITNNKGEGKFPGFFASINKDGKEYIKNNFIGNKVAFTTYEAGKINSAATAKPNTPASFDSVVVPQSNDFTPDTLGLDLDFDMPEL